MSVAFANEVRSPALAHDVHGSGPTLVLLHGLSHRRHAWDPVVDILAKHRRVVTVDLPGHGESPMPEGDGDPVDASLQQLQQFLHDVTPAGELPHVAGNSLGGWAALELAARGHAQSATALSPAGFAVNKLDHRRSLAMFTGLRGAVRMVGERTVYSALKQTQARSLMLAAFYGRPWLADVTAARIDVTALLENQIIDRAPDSSLTFSPVSDKDCRMTVVWGRRDLILPVYQASRVKHTFPDATVIKVPGLGHVPMKDNPQLIAAMILAGSS